MQIALTEEEKEILEKFREENTKRNTWVAGVIPTPEQIEAARKRYSEAPFGHYFFRHDVSDSRYSSYYTTISRKTSNDVNFNGKKSRFMPMFSSFPIWTYDPEISIHWNDPEKDSYPTTIYTYRNYSSCFYFSNPDSLILEDFTDKLEEKYNFWIEKYNLNSKKEPLKRSLFMPSYGDPKSLTSIIGISDFKDLNRFFQRFLYGSEIRFSKDRWNLFKEHKDLLKELFF